MIRSLLTSLLVGCLELVGSSLGAELDSATCLQLGFNPAKVKQEEYLCNWMIVYCGSRPCDQWVQS